jgi:hypothetical protein
MRQQPHFKVVGSTPAWIVLVGVLTWVVYKAYLFMVTAPGFPR